MVSDVTMSANIILYMYMQDIMNYVEKVFIQLLQFDHQLMSLDMSGSHTHPNNHPLTPTHTYISSKTRTVICTWFTGTPTCCRLTQTVPTP